MANKKYEVKTRKGVMKRVQRQHFSEKGQKSYFAEFFVFDKKNNKFSNYLHQANCSLNGNSYSNGGFEKQVRLGKVNETGNYTTAKIKSKTKKAVFTSFENGTMCFEYIVKNESKLVTDGDLQKFEDPRLPKITKSIVSIDTNTGEYTITIYNDDKIRMKQSGEISTSILQKENLIIDFIVVKSTTSTVTFMIENNDVLNDIFDEKENKYTRGLGKSYPAVMQSEDYKKLIVFDHFFDNKWNVFGFVSYGDQKVTIVNDDGEDIAQYKQIDIKEKALSIYINSSVSFEIYVIDEENNVENYRRDIIEASKKDGNWLIRINDVLLDQHLDMNIPNLIDIGNSMKDSGIYIDYASDPIGKIVRDVCTFTDIGFEWKLVVFPMPLDNYKDFEVIRTITYNKKNNIISYKDENTKLEYEMKIDPENGRITYYHDNDFMYFREELESFEFQSRWMFADEARIRANQFGIPTTPIR